MAWLMKMEMDMEMRKPTAPMVIWMDLEVNTLIFFSIFFSHGCAFFCSVALFRSIHFTKKIDWFGCVMIYKKQPRIYIHLWRNCNCILNWKFRSRLIIWNQSKSFSLYRVVKLFRPKFHSLHFEKKIIKNVKRSNYFLSTIRLSFSLIWPISHHYVNLWINDTMSYNVVIFKQTTIQTTGGSDLSLDSPKMRKIPQPRELQKNGFNLATPIKRNGLIGNGYAEAPLTNLSSSSTSSMFTNNSSVSMSSGKTDSSSAAALTRSPRFQPSSPRNPILGIGCNVADLYRGRRRTERGILVFPLLVRRPFAHLNTGLVTSLLVLLIFFFPLSLWFLLGIPQCFHHLCRYFILWNFHF